MSDGMRRDTRRESAVSGDPLRLAREAINEIRRRFDDAINASVGTMVLEDRVRSDTGQSVLRLDALDNPERTLSVVVDPVAGTVEWEFHYAEAVVRSGRVSLKQFDSAYLDELVGVLKDRNAWLRGEFAIREHRA